MEATINKSSQKPGDAYQKENASYPSKQHHTGFGTEIQNAASDIWKSLTDPVGEGGSLPKELREEQKSESSGKHRGDGCKKYCGWELRQEAGKCGREEVKTLI